MFLPLILAGVAVAGLSGISYYQKAVLKKGVFTPERKHVFAEAMTKMTDASKLNKLASVFKSQGLNVQAHMLRMRAKIRAVPPDVKKERQKIFRETLKLTDPNKVLTIANAFHKEGAVGAAAELRKYAAGLK